MEERNKRLLLGVFVLGAILLVGILVFAGKGNKLEQEGVFAKGDMPESAIAKANELYSSLKASGNAASIEVKVDEKLELKKTVIGSLDSSQSAMLDELVSLMAQIRDIKVLIVVFEGSSSPPPTELPSVCSETQLSVKFAYLNCNIEVVNAGLQKVEGADLSFSPSGNSYPDAVGSLDSGASQAIPLPPAEKEMGELKTTAKVFDGDTLRSCEQSFAPEPAGYSNCY